MFLRVLNKGFLRVRTYESVKFRAYFLRSMLSAISYENSMEFRCE